MFYIGKEERAYQQAQYSKNTINKAILEKTKLVNALYPGEPLDNFRHKRNSDRCKKITNFLGSYLNEVRASKQAEIGPGRGPENKLWTFPSNRPNVLCKQAK